MLVAASFVGLGGGGIFHLLPWRRGAETGAIRDEGGRAEAPAFPPIPMLLVTVGGVVEASAEARGLLGLPKEGAMTSGLFLSRIAGPHADFERRLLRLQAEGESFRDVVETRDGRVLEVEGAPFGGEALISLHDQTRLWRRAAEAERRAAALEGELAEFRAALRATGAVVWRAGAERPSHVSEALDAAAREAGAAPRRVIVPSADGAPEAAYDLHPAEGGVFAATDASRALAAERAMSRFVDTISETFAHLHVGLMIFDAGRRLSLFNPVVASLCGEEADWLARRPSLRDLLDRMRRARTLPEQADYAGWRSRLIARVGGEIAEPYDETWHLADGRTMKAIFRPHAAGGLAVVIEDVTESVALKRVNAVERAAQDATTDLLEEGIVIFGPDGRFRKANQSFRAFWGFDEGAPASGEHIDDVIAGCRALTGPHAFWRDLKAAAAGGGARRAGAAAFELTDGRRLSARISPMPDGATLAVFVDVTASAQVAAALKERNDALLQSEEMRSALVDQISHQMRTPLNSIFGFGQLLDEGRVGPLTPVQAEYVKGIVSSSNELLSAIDGMADLISVGADAPREAPAVFDPVRALGDVAAMVERRSARRGAAIRLDVAAAPVSALGHRIRFRQIVFNMATDAIFRTPPEGEIRLSLKAEGGDLLLECRHEITDQMQEQSLALTLVRRFLWLQGGDLKVGRDEAGLRLMRCRIAGFEPAEGAVAKSA